MNSAKLKLCQVSLVVLLSAIEAWAGVQGTVVGWGDNTHGQSSVVPSNVSGAIAIAAGAAHSLALKRDGTLAIWGEGYNGSSYTNVTLPPNLSNVVAISVGFFHSLALKNNGTVVGWGYDEFGAASGASGLQNVAAISASADHSLAMKSNGTIVAWGRATAGSTTVPSGLNNVSAISAGQVHNLALRRDGSVVGWGANSFGQATGIPTPATPGNPYGASTGVVTI